MKIVIVFVLFTFVCIFFAAIRIILVLLLLASASGQFIRRNDRKKQTFRIPTLATTTPEVKVESTTIFDPNSISARLRFRATRIMNRNSFGRKIYSQETAQAEYEITTERREPVATVSFPEKFENSSLLVNGIGKRDESVETLNVFASIESTTDPSSLAARLNRYSHLKNRNNRRYFSENLKETQIAIEPEISTILPSSIMSIHTPHSVIHTTPLSVTSSSTHSTRETSHHPTTVRATQTEKVLPTSLHSVISSSRVTSTPHSIH